MKSDSVPKIELVESIYREEQYSPGREYLNTCAAVLARALLIGIGAGTLRFGAGVYQIAGMLEQAGMIPPLIGASTPELARILILQVLPYSIGGTVICTIADFNHNIQTQAQAIQDLCQNLSARQIGQQTLIWATGAFTSGLAAFSVPAVRQIYFQHVYPPLNVPDVARLITSHEGADEQLKDN